MKYVRPEQLDAEVELEQVCGFLKDAGIRHWLSGGTMLGIYRDGKFIELDTDIDIGIRGEDVRDIKSVIPWEMWTSKNPPWQTSFSSPRDIPIDLTWFWKDGDNIINKNTHGTWVKPKDKMENLTAVYFKGVEYPCADPVWYLEHRYREWKIRKPKKVMDWLEFAGDFLYRNGSKW